MGFVWKMKYSKLDSEGLELKSKFDFFRTHNIVYLDNAATTQVPDSVVRAVNQVLKGLR